MPPIKSEKKTENTKPQGVPSQVHLQLRQDLARLAKDYKIAKDLTKLNHKPYIHRFLGECVDLDALYKHLVDRECDTNLAGTEAKIITGKFWTFFLQNVYDENFPKVDRDQLFVMKCKDQNLPKPGTKINEQRKLNKNFFEAKGYELQKLEDAVKQCFETPEDKFPGWVRTKGWSTLIRETQPVDDSNEEELAENAATPGPAGHKEEQRFFGNLNTDVSEDQNPEEGPEATSRAHPAHAAQAQGQGGSSPQTPRVVDATALECPRCRTPVQARAPQPRLPDSVKHLSPEAILGVMDSHGLNVAGDNRANECAKQLSKLVLMSLSADRINSLVGSSGDNSGDAETAVMPRPAERTTSMSSLFENLEDITQLPK